ncbi:MAG: anti-sigma factor [Cytophagaceae bacterium]
MKEDFTNWKENKVDNHKCNNWVGCLRTLQAVIDKEATREEEEAFLSHIEECMPCYTMFKMDHTIKKVVLKKIEKKPVPLYLANSIMAKIKKQ